MDRVPVYRDSAVVLRVTKLGEADRIVTLLTRREGRVRAVAKGVRRTKSRFGGRLEPFSHVDLQLYAGRNLDIVTQAETLDPFGPVLAADYSALHLRDRHRGDRRAADRGGAGAVAAAVPAGGVRAAGAGGDRPRSVPGAGCLPAAGDGAGRLGAGADRVRALRHARSARGLPHRLRRAALPGLPGAGSVGTVRPAPATVAADGGAGRRRLGRPPRRRPASPAGRRPAWSRPCCSGISNGACGRWRWSTGAATSRSAGDRPGILALRSDGPGPRQPRAADTRIPAAPGRRHCRRRPCPQHVALVMDGNGRWAKARGLPRTEGHKRGEAALFDVVEGAIEIGVTHLSAYAFSTENWKRSPDEVRFLMGFNRDVIRRRRDDMHALGVRVRWAGRRPRLWRSVIKELEVAEQLTAANRVLTLTMCVNYGGRAEIADAAKAIAVEAAAGRIDPAKVDERMLARYLDEPDMPDVDLFLRPSGEQRTSNFLIWQSAYAELVFQDTLFPDFDRRDLWRACQEYAVPAAPVRRGDRRGEAGRRSFVSAKYRGSDQTDDRGRAVGSEVVRDGSRYRRSEPGIPRPTCQPDSPSSGRRGRRLARRTAAAGEEALPPGFAGDLRRRCCCWPSFSGARWNRCSGTRSCRAGRRSSWRSACRPPRSWCWASWCPVPSPRSCRPRCSPGSCPAMRAGRPRRGRLRGRAARLRMRIGADLEPADGARCPAVGVLGVHAVRAGDQPDRADRHRRRLHRDTVDGVGPADRRAADRGDRRAGSGSGSAGRNG